MGKILGAFIFIKARLGEPSTLAAIAAVFSVTGHQLDPGIIVNFTTLGTLVFGAAGFFIPEAKPLAKL